MNLSSWPLWVGCALMAVSAITTYSSLLVPNVLTFPAIAAGLLVSILLGGQIGGDWVSSLVGIGASLTFMIPMYRYGLGAGSVKMQMAFGAWIGAAFPSDWCFLFCIAAAILGSLAAYLTTRVLSKREVAKIQASEDYGPESPKMYPAQVPLTIGSLIGVGLSLWFKSTGFFG